jgi:uncharacterized protein YbjT (DUF2867 family)
LHTPGRRWRIDAARGRAHDASMFVIAGVSGRTGRVVAETLLAGEKVRVVVRDPRQGKGWRARGAEVAVASLDDAAALARALDGAVGFYTLLPEDPAVPDHHAHRVHMADAIAAAVRASGVPHVVLLSALAAVVPDGNGPAQALHHAELALRAAATLTALRATLFLDNFALALPAARGEGIYPCFLPSADLAVPMVAACDVGRVAARCLVEPPRASEVVDVLGPLTTTNAIAAALGSALEIPLRVVEIPAAAHADVLAAAGVPRRFAEAVAELHACVASGRVSPRGDRTVLGTTTIAEALTGYVRASRSPRSAVGSA